MEDIDDVSYQRYLSDAWELRESIARLNKSLEDPRYDNNDRDDLKIAQKAALAALRDVHNDLQALGAEVPFYTSKLVPQPSDAKLRDVPREEVF